MGVDPSNALALVFAFDPIPDPDDPESSSGPETLRLVGVAAEGKRQ